MSTRSGRALRRCALAAAVLSAGLLPLSATARADGLHRTSDLLPAIALARPLGPVPSDREIHAAVVLTDPRGREERQLAAAVVDPQTPQYRRFLTPNQYASRFALPAVVRDGVLRWLRHGGVRVDQVSGLGDLISVTGTAGGLARLFDVHLNTYRLGGTTFVANDVAPRVPGAVHAVLGLDTLQRFAPVGHGADPAAWRVIGPRPAVGAFTADIDVRKLWTAYDAPPGNEGEGIRVGVFMTGNTAPVIGSLRAFEEDEKLPAVPVRIVFAEPGRPDDFQSNAGANEWMLDTQAATGMAPRVADLTLYTARSLGDADIVAEFAYWANDPTGPDLMNASFGACEAFPVVTQSGRGSLGAVIGNNIQDAVDKELMQAFTEGRTLFASSGDTGSSCPVVSLPTVGAGNGAANQVVPDQIYPAGSQWATAVGGTVLNLDAAGKRTQEESWAFGGGGSAFFIPRPAWQSSEPAVNRPCLLLDSDGSRLDPGTICRGLPDVAALSGSATQGFEMYGYDLPTGAAGTSVSSPLMMGMWARVAAASLRPLGPAAPAVYGLTSAQRARDFYDVTAGELVGNGLYVPGPGWDYTSGYGVPDVAHLAADLAGGTAPVRHPGASAVAGPETGSLSGNAVACRPFGTSPPGNVDTSTLGDRGLTRDLTSASMTLSSDQQSLVIAVRGPQLGPDVPPGALTTNVQVAWIYGGRSYVARAVADLSGTVTGTVKTVSRDANPEQNPHTFPARYANHELIMTIPLTAIGSPPLGARLRHPVALSGTDTDVDDVAGPTYDYTVGQRCR